MLKILVSSLIAAAALVAAHSAPPAAPPASAAMPAPAPADARFSAVVEGMGPDVILIPGLMSSRKVYDDAVAGLGGRYRVHRLQIAGFAGEPAAGNAGEGMLDGIVGQLDAYVKARHLHHPAIVGHSMGGLIAMMLAARHPESAGPVMVIDALPFYGLLFGPDATVEAVRPRAASFRDSILAAPETAWRAQQPATMAALVRTEAARPFLVEAALASDRRVAAEAIYEDLTTDARPLLPAIRSPLTVLYATREAAPAAAAGALYRSAYAAAPGARLVEVPASYHFIMIDQPERFRALLLEFLSKGRSAAVQPR
jgi:pimeloyl-ACP methyl ester carboxylesterase